MYMFFFNVHFLLTLTVDAVLYKISKDVPVTLNKIGLGSRSDLKVLHKSDLIGSWLISDDRYEKQVADIRYLLFRISFEVFH